MNLTIAAITYDPNIKAVFSLADYDMDELQHSQFYFIISNKMGMTIQELKNELRVNFNGVTHDTYEGVYFYDIKDAKRALEWVESIIVAKKLQGKEKNKFGELRFMSFDPAFGNDTSVFFLGSNSKVMAIKNIKVK